MRAQAKRSSAANSDGSAPGGTVSRWGIASRASSRRADGSSAPSIRPTKTIMTALALAIATLSLLALAPSAMAAPPVVTDVGAVQVSDTSARLVGVIDPEGSETSYLFQYGETPALGSSTEGAAIGDGTEPVYVDQVVNGLAPDTTYFFRLAATNDEGTTDSVNRELHTRAEPFPAPTSRAWEQVTPVDKNYGDADSVAGVGLPNEAGISTDGEAAAFCTAALFGEPTGNMYWSCAAYVSRRTSSGWQTTQPFPATCHIDQTTGAFPAFYQANISPDFRSFVMMREESDGCPNVLPLSPDAPLVTDPNAYPFAKNFYFGDIATSEYQLLNPNLDDEDGGLRFQGGTDDFSHVVYLARDNQTDPPDSPAPNTLNKLYLWVRQGHSDCVQAGGCLSLLGKDPSNVPFSTDVTLPTRNLAGAQYPLRTAVSRDGERIYFQTGAPHEGIGLPVCVLAPTGCKLWLRESGTTTIDVSATECTVECGEPENRGIEFLSANPTGDKAFFETCAKLTDTSSPDGGCINGGPQAGIGKKLYRWDRNSPAGARLVDLTVDEEPADDVQPDFRGLLGHSDDGEIAYFVAGGQLVPGAPTSGELKLYRWRWNAGSPTVDYLGPYRELDGGLTSDINTSLQRKPVTPDGQYLLLYTEVRLLPAADSDSDADAYRWDEANGWMCVSCQLPGVPSVGAVDLTEVKLSGRGQVVTPVLGSHLERHFISDDGQRIFFGSLDALVPEDVNGELGCSVIREYPKIYSCTDVYEWHDGTVRLVSSGVGNSPAVLISASPSGRDAFFFSREHLVGWDKDNNVDIYDSRIGGGFPEPPPVPPPCEGEGCRSAGTAPSANVGAGTAVFQGPGNSTSVARRCGKGQVKRRGRCVSKKKRHKQRAANRNRRTAR